MSIDVVHTQEGAEHGECVSVLQGPGSYWSEDDYTELTERDGVAEVFCFDRKTVICFTFNEASAAYRVDNKILVSWTSWSLTVETTVMSSKYAKHDFHVNI